MVRPTYADGIRPTMFIAGNDEGGGFMTGAAEDLRAWRQP